MDPNAILQLINDDIVGFDPQDPGEAEERAEDLRRWIAAGGVGPNWSLYPKATAFYSAHMIAFWKGLHHA